MIQHDAAYVLFMLGSQVRSWKRVRELPEKLLHPMTFETLTEVLDHLHSSSLHTVLNHFLLKPFETRGLLEAHEKKKDYLYQKKTVRTTPFYNQWIRFQKRRSGQSVPIPPR